MTPLLSYKEGYKVLCNTGALVERSFYGLQRLLCDLYGVTRRLFQTVKVHVWTREQSFQGEHTISQEALNDLYSFALVCHTAPFAFCASFWASHVLAAH